MHGAYRKFEHHVQPEILAAELYGTELVPFPSKRSSNPKVPPPHIAIGPGGSLPMNMLLTKR
ncbi:hypothetical protein TWF506_004745 [Arthrobotrys conoides]|uniref:Uncharacterized protein n=1 Tax=Arthrobotrys conoides TaxID=74498 RepID=A0AAN8RTB7_9PEZI